MSITKKEMQKMKVQMTQNKPVDRGNTWVGVRGSVIQSKNPKYNVKRRRAADKQLCTAWKKEEIS